VLITPLALRCWKKKVLPEPFGPANNLNLG
jgi:hypothetical protein